MKNANILMAVLVVGLLLGVGFFIIKDSKKPSLSEASKVTISEKQILKLINDIGINPPTNNISRGTYSLISEKWVNNTVAIEYGIYLTNHNLLIYDDETNNCIHYSQNFDKVLKTIYETKSTSNPATGLIYYFSLSSPDPHVINIMVVLDEDKNPKIKFFEPQWNIFIDLNKTEKEHVFEIVF